MRVLHYAVVLAVVLGVSMATAQEADKPEEKTLPWWKLSDDTAAKDRPQLKDDVRELKSAEAEKKESPRRDVPPVLRERPGYAPREEPAPSDWRLPPPASRQAPKPAARERLVYRLANAPSIDVARTVNELLKSESAIAGLPVTRSGSTVVLAEAVSNSLIISGTSEAIHETVKLVEQLDTEPLMVCVQVVIGLIESREGLSLLAPNPEGPELSCSHEEACKLIEEFSKSDAVKILARPQVMTLDNQPAFIQIGQRVPRAVMGNSKEGLVVATELENVGLIVGVTPRISPDHVVTMEIDAERSELSPESEGVPLGVDAQGNVVRSPRIEVMSVQTTVQIPPSRAVIIGGLTLQDGDKRGELVFVVTPHVVARKK